MNDKPTQQKAASKKTGRKKAVAAAGLVGSAAALIGAGITVQAGPSRDADVQQARLTAFTPPAPPSGKIIQNPDGTLGIGPGPDGMPTPLLNLGVPGNGKIFGESFQFNLSLSKLFGLDNTGTSAGQPLSVADVLGVGATITPPPDSGIAGNLPFNNLSRVATTIFDNLNGNVQVSSPALPFTLGTPGSPGTAATNFIDPQPASMKPTAVDLASGDPTLNGLTNLFNFIPQLSDSLSQPVVPPVPGGALIPAGGTLIPAGANPSDFASTGGSSTTQQTFDAWLGIRPSDAGNTDVGATSPAATSPAVGPAAATSPAVGPAAATSPAGAITTNRNGTTSTGSGLPPGSLGPLPSNVTVGLTVGGDSSGHIGAIGSVSIPVDFTGLGDSGGGGF